MTLIACGLNHKTAPLALRERFAFSQENLALAIQDLLEYCRARGVAILSTCNRTEFYFDLDQKELIQDWLGEQGFNAPDVSSSLYLYEDEAAIKHILRVASGLDSMILGEPQILGQLKAAVTTAEQVGTLGPLLQRLFQYVFATTKKIRAETAIGVNPVSFVSASMSIAKRIFADLGSCEVLLIGAGEISELAMRYFTKLQISNVTITNRTFERAATLATQFNAKALPLPELATVLPKTDIIIAATASSLPLLGKGALESALKKRRHKPMLVVDLAVPRNVEAEVAQLSDIYLYTVDDLQSIINENWREREQAAIQAETLVEMQATHFMRYLQSLNAVTTIRSYRHKMGALFDAELLQALQHLQSGMSPATVLQKLVHRLRNKVLHAPTIGMRRAAYMGQHELLELAQQLFDLEAPL